MKIGRPSFEGCRSRKLYGIIPLWVIVVGVISIVAGATFLTVQNSATILAGGTVSGVQVPAGTTTCSSSSGAYGQSPAIAWGSFPAGTTQTALLCITNT